MKLTTSLSLLTLVFACGGNQESNRAVVEDNSDPKAAEIVNDKATSNTIQVSSVEKLWESPAEFDIPECVIYDEEHQRLIVSCIGVGIMDRNGKGYLSLLSLEGKILELKWVIGLNAPKGMAIAKGKLYVSDIDELVVIDLSSGEISKQYRGKRAMFLNDIAIKGNSVYVSDMRTGAIWRLLDQDFSIWLDWQTIVSPNGLYAEEDYLAVGGESGSIEKIGYKTKKVEPLISNTGSIDGLEKIGSNGYLISDWYGHITHVTVQGQRVLLTPDDDGNQKADIEYIAEKQMLIIPTFHGNSVTAYHLNLE